MAVTSNGTATVTLPADDQILITREFAAPKRLVFKAWTTPELVKRWWAGQRGEVTSAQIDLRVGGKWRWVMMANGNFEVAFHGEYREIVADELLVMTQVYEAVPDAPALCTLTFTEVARRTTLKILVQHTSTENRDGHINAGMEAGMQESLDLLEQLAVSLT
ncbi:MAG: SRPBCC family protein [Acidimicrobiales bacterium]